MSISVKLPNLHTTILPYMHPRLMIKVKHRHIRVINLLTSVCCVQQRETGPWAKGTRAVSNNSTKAVGFKGL